MIDYNKKFGPKLLSFLLFSMSFLGYSQTQPIWTSSEIQKGIEKLNFLGSALYFAAHPDDENTRLISYLASDVQANVAYLSLTRGDGGQNLIGTEIREGLGLIRTQELLQARRVDGGGQFFSTANDFGFSKNPTETFQIWDKEKVMDDAVWIIRNFQPDIIINRFDHRTPGTTHGHHTSSAMISYDAFDIAADKDAFPNQLDRVSVWQTKRLFFNTSTWFYGGQEAFDKADKSNFYQVNIGTFYPEFGLSNNEIAGKSRSMHKSQGFGSRESRGNTTEYLELLKGDSSVDREDLFAGINTTWSRVPGGKHISKKVDKVLAQYDLAHPERSIKDLVKLRKAIYALDNHHWRTIKLKELDAIIAQCAGIYLSFDTNESYGSPGTNFNARLEVISRNSSSQLKGVHIAYYKEDKTVSKNRVDWDVSAMEINTDYSESVTIDIPKNILLSNPYWLNQEPTLGNYQVSDYDYIGKPEAKSVIQAEFDLLIEGEQISFSRELKHRFVDPVRGEVHDPFQVVPEFSLNFQEQVSIFADDQKRELHLKIRAAKNDAQGEVYLVAPKNWIISPSRIPFTIAEKGEELDVVFSVQPPKNSEEVYIEARLADTGVKSLTEVAYDHIPKQYMYQTARQKLARVQVESRGERVAYIMGAGDEVPLAIEQLGYEVDLLEVKQIQKEMLRKYDAVVLGVRSLNVHEELKFKMPVLKDYVFEGGNVIVQYNTSRGLKVDDFSPYAISLSRLRVTDEKAEVRILDPNHPAMNYPNSITSADFDGWVQERGLYFPQQWDSNYHAILGSNDLGESSLDGGLLIAQYGKGYYTYTGYSWFRELPAGVVGAYRIFANLLSLGHEEN